jgi:hypothetical protein
MLLDLKTENDTMIYTSYFSSKKFNTNDGIAVTLGASWWKGKFYKALAPTPKILSWWKNLSKEEQLTPKNKAIYETLYKRDVLSKLDVNKVAKDLDGKVLLCFEKSNDFCHRHIIAKWLNENGYKCEEL